MTITPWALSSHLSVFGNTLLKINDFDLAENCIYAYHDRVKQAGYLWGIANSKWPMGDLLIAKGDVVSGLAWIQDALQLYVQIEDVWSAQQISNATHVLRYCVVNWTMQWSLKATPVVL